MDPNHQRSGNLKKNRKAAEHFCYGNERNRNGSERNRNGMERNRNGSERNRNGMERFI